MSRQNWRDLPAALLLLIIVALFCYAFTLTGSVWTRQSCSAPYVTEVTIPLDPDTGAGLLIISTPAFCDAVVFATAQDLGLSVVRLEAGSHTTGTAYIQVQSVVLNPPNEQVTVNVLVMEKS